MGHTHEKLNDISKLIGKLKADYPAETNAFLGFMIRAEGGKALTIREKELINVGLSATPLFGVAQPQFEPWQLETRITSEKLDQLLQQEMHRFMDIQQTQMDMLGGFRNKNELQAAL